MSQVSEPLHHSHNSQIQNITFIISIVRVKNCTCLSISSVVVKLRFLTYTVVLGSGPNSVSADDLSFLLVLSVGRIFYI